MNRSIHIVTIMNIPIELNYSWFIVFFLVTWTLAQSYFPAVVPGQPVIVYWAMGIIAALLFFISLLAHELSHSVVAANNNLPISGISLFIFGGVAHMSKEPQNPRTEFLMAAAGPLCSFSIALVFFVLTQLFYGLHFPPAVIVIFDYLAVINLIVGVFNLIPAFPLDGGRILRSALWTFYGDLKRSTMVASSLGKAFAYFLMGAGILYLFYGAIISGIWLVFIGFFLQEAASTSYEQVAMKRTLTGAAVMNIMTKDVVTVSEELTLLSLVDDFFFRLRFTSFPVVSENGEIKGLITIHAVKDIPREKWGTTTVKEAMLPLRRDFVVSPQVDVFEALTRMASNGIRKVAGNTGRQTDRHNFTKGRDKAF